MLPPVRICLVVAVTALDQQVHVDVAIHLDHAVRVDVDVAASHRDRTDGESLVLSVDLLETGDVFVESSRRELHRQAVRDIVSPPEGEAVSWQELVQEAVGRPGSGEGLCPSMCIALVRHDWDLLGRPRQVARVSRILLVEPEHGARRNTIVADRDRLRGLPVELEIAR